MTTRRSRKSSATNGRWALWLVASAGVVAVLLAMWLVLSLLPDAIPTAERDTTLTSQPAAAPAQAPPVDADAPTISATLFFVASNGTRLTGVTRAIPYADTALEQARRIAEAQVARPPSGLSSAIPAGTMVRSVFLSDRGEAYLDLSRDFRTGHSGGSLNEALAVYALVNAMTSNLADVSAVQILIDGQEVDTLAGHLDLRHPLQRSDRWVQRGP
jgi:spore germination protein GerM